MLRSDRPRLRAGLPIVLCMIVALGAASSCTSDDANTQGPPTRAQVAKLLQRQGEAVLARDRSTYLAGFADAFARRQTGVFDNLTRVPLTQWSYRLGSPVGDADALRAVRRKYGDSATIVKVELRYAIRAVDPVPTTRDLWWTVVQRDGRPVVVGDSDLAAAGGTTWHGPWDYGRLDVVRGRSALVLGHPQDAALNRAVAATIDRSVPTVTSVWGTAWMRTVAAVVPASDAELQSALGPTAGTDAEIGAIAQTDSQDPVSGRPLGQRIVVVADELRRLSAVGRRIVLQHEVTHVAAARDTSTSTPRWLTEGFAEYVGNLHSGQSTRAAARELVAELRRAGPPRSLPDAAQFETADTAAVAYQLSWLACRYLASLVGQDGLVRFYRAVSAATSTDAVADALRRVARTTPTRFVAGWRTYVQDRLR